MASQYVTCFMTHDAWNFELAARFFWKICSCASGFELFGLGPAWELGFAHLQAAVTTDSSAKSVYTRTVL